MKKLFLILSLAALTACGGGGSMEEDLPAALEAAVVAAAPTVADAVMVADAAASTKSAKLVRDVPAPVAVKDVVETAKGAVRYIPPPMQSVIAKPLNFNYTDGAIPSLVVMGDSLASEAWGSWSDQLTKSLDTRMAHYRNMAIPGQPCLYDAAYFNKRVAQEVQPGGTIIWFCGSNDVAKGFGQQHVAVNVIKTLHPQLQAAGQRLIVATVPVMTDWCFHTEYSCLDARLEHNQELKAWAAANSVPIIKLDEMFPYTSDTRYYVDGLHFTQLANTMIFEALRKLF